MSTVKRMFQLSLTTREVVRAKRVMASIMLPILVFYMTSMNILAMEMMKANAEEAAVIADSSKEDTSKSGESGKKEDKSLETDKKTEETVKDEVKKDEEAVEAVKAETVVTDIAKDDATKTDTEKTVEADKSDTGKTIETTKTDAPVVTTDEKTEETPRAEMTTEVKEASWVVDGKTATISPVELNKTYKAPQNDKVTVTFTKLPASPGSLVVREIKLSADEQSSLGALSDTAYDITSDMVNGTFAYDLTLPYPDKDSDGKAEIAGNTKNEVKADDLQVLYTEDKSGDLKKDDMKEVKDNTGTDKSNKVIEIKNLDHFTIFVVTNPNGAGDGNNSSDFCATADAGGVFQCFSSLTSAIAAVSAGSTILINPNTYIESPTINKDLTLELNGDVTFNGTLTISGTSSDLILKSHGHTLTANIITNGGVIKNATGDGNITLVAATGDLTARTITSVGDVSLTATAGNIKDDATASQSTYITGTNITLSSPAGSIGSYDTTISTTTNFNKGVDVKLNGGTLNASALNDVAVTEVIGTSMDSSDYNLTSATAGKYVILGNMTASGNFNIDSALDSDALIRLVAAGNMTVNSDVTTSSSNVELYAKGNITLNKSLTAGTNAVLKAGFSSGTGSIIDDGSQDTTINATNITLNANGGTASNITASGDGTIDFLDAVDVALGGGTLTTNGGYVTETSGARNGTYNLNGGNLSLSKAFSGASSITSDNGKLTISDDNTSANILIGEYSGSVASGLDAGTPIGTYYEVQTEGSITDDVNVQINYTDGEVTSAGLASENQINGIYYYSGGWQMYPVGDTTVTPGTNTVLVHASHLTPIVLGADTTPPHVDTVAWNDVDGSTDISGTDTVAVTFSEGINTGTIDTSNVDARLGLSGGHTFGTTGNGMSLAWSAGDTILTITLGTDMTVATGDTIDPTTDVTDKYSNGDATPTPLTITDNVKPNVTALTSGAPNPTKDSPQAGSIIFSENVTGLDAGDFTVTNCTIDNLSGSGKSYTFNINPTADGAVAVSFGADKVTDAAGNENNASGSTITFDYDTTAPTVGVNTKDTGDQTPFLRGTYSDAHAVTSISIVVDGHTYAATVDYDGAGTWGAQVTDTLADGTYDVAATATDAAGNVGTDATTNELTVNHNPPVLSSFTSTTGNGTYGIGSVINITANYNKNLDSGSHLTVTLDDGASVILNSVSGSSVSGSYTVASGQSSADLTVAAITLEDVNDLFANNQGSSTVPVSPNNIADTSDIVIDGVAPTVTLSTTSATPTNVAPIPVEITFDSDVTGFEIGDITVGNGTAGDFTETTASRVWTINITPSGQGAVTAQVAAGKAVDAGNNGNTISNTVTVTYDTVAPGAPTVTGATPTNDQTPTWSWVQDGVNPGNGTFRYKLDDSDLSSGYTETTDVNFTPGSDLSEGTHTLYVIERDAAGNWSTAGSHTITIDVTDPNIVITRTPDQDLYNHDYSISVDFGDSASGQQYSVDGGGWTDYTAPFTVTGDGSHTVDAHGTDSAGNVGDATQVTFTIDTVAPTVPNAPDLQAASDSGVSDSDNITNDTTPTFDISGVLNPDKYRVYRDAAFIAEVNSTETSWTSGTLADGTYIFTFRSIDPAGNESGDSATLTVTIDTAAPAIANAPDLQAGSDSGNNSDNITNDTTPTFDITGFGTYYRIYQSASPLTQVSGDYESASPWTSAALADGTYNFTVRSVDAAGNEATDSTALTVTIDTAGPDAPVVTLTDPINDGNKSSVALSITGDTGTTYNYLIDDANAGTAGITGGGAMNISPKDLTGIDVSSLDDGVNIIVASVTLTDVAGNTSAAGTDTVSKDTGIPAAPAITGITDDTATLGDGITSDNTLSVSGTAEASSTVTVYLNGSSIGTTMADGTTGVWTFDYTGTTLADGDYTFTATAIDAAGNVSPASADYDVTVDTGAPAAPAVTAIAVDTGISGSDGITSDNTLTISGTAEVNSTVEVFKGGVSLGTTSANGSGDWSYDNTADVLADGTYAFTATAKDAAGNTSSISVAFSAVIDNAAPDKPVITGIADDTGSSSTDRITNDTTPTVSGTAEANSTVEVFVDGGSQGTVTADGSGNWTFTLSALVDDDYDLTVQATDAAGNTGLTSDVYEITVDTNAPAGYTVSIDQAVINNANKTAMSFTFFGAEVGATYNYSIGVVTGSGTIATATDQITGIDVSGLADGALTLSVTLTDTAGNTGSAATDTVTKDTVAPTVTVDSLRTNNTKPTVTGTIDDNSATISVDVDGHTYTGTNNGDGTWSVNITNDLAEGTYDVAVTAIDTSSNAGTDSTTNELVIDLTAPTLTSISIASRNTNATLAKVGDTVTVTFVSDEGIQAPTATISGQAATIHAGVDNQHWTATYVMQSTDAEGAVTFAISFTDLAGNAGLAVSTVTDATSVTFDKMAPTLSLVTIASNHTNTNYAKVGHEITVTFTSSEDILTPTATISGHAATVAGAGSNWTAKYTMADGDTEGVIAFTIDFADLAGNTGTQSSSTTDATSVIFDKTAPSMPNYRTDEGNWYNSRPTNLDIDFSDNYMLDYVNYKLDSDGTERQVTDGDIAVYTTNWGLAAADWDAMDNGANYYLYFHLVDMAGNEYVTPNNNDGFFLRRDTNDPDDPDYNDPQGKEYASRPTDIDIDFSDGEALEKVEYKVVDSTDDGWKDIEDGISGKEYTSNWSMNASVWEGLEDGTHHISFRITDDAGNVNTVTDGYEFVKNTSSGGGAGGTVQGAQSGGGEDQGVLGEESNGGNEGNQGVLGEEGQNISTPSPWRSAMPYEAAGLLVLIGGGIWWWIRRGGKGAGQGGGTSMFLLALKDAASKARMFLW